MTEQELDLVRGQRLLSIWEEQCYYLRIFEPKGRYLRGSFATPDSLYFVDDEMAFMVTHSTPWDWWSEDSSLPITEMTWASAQEIRLMASILLCESDDGPSVCFYPTRDALYLDVPSLDLSSPESLSRIQELLRKHIPATEWPSREHIVHECFSQNYEFVPSEEFHLARQSEFLQAISPTDHLLIRGLGTLIKAEMLAAHYEFWEEATVIVFIALEASFQLVLRELQRKGISQPTAADAGMWMHKTFHEPYGWEADTVTRYYEEFYEQRVMTLHPASRYGVVPYAPLFHDDYMFLRKSLRAVFAYLATGKHSPDFITATGQR